MDEKMKKKLRERMKAHWRELSFEEKLEARKEISEGMRRKHRERTPEERRAIALKAAETRRTNQIAKAKEREDGE